MKSLFEPRQTPDALDRWAQTVKDRLENIPEIDDSWTQSCDIEQNSKEVWALRNKYACGSVWGEDRAFDNWWVKQVAKARNLNTVKKIVSYVAVAAVGIWFITSELEQSKEDSERNKHEAVLWSIIQSPTSTQIEKDRAQDELNSMEDADQNREDQYRE
jgi:hypothetical protein